MSKLIEIEDVPENKQISEEVENKKITKTRKKREPSNLTYIKKDEKEKLLEQLKENEKIESKKQLEAVQDDSPIDLRGMIRDVVRSEMLDHIPKMSMQRVDQVQHPRRKHKISTYTDSEIDVEKVKIRKPKKLISQPKQILVPQSKIEQPISNFNKKPEYNPFVDIFGFSS